MNKEPVLILHAVQALVAVGVVALNLSSDMTAVILAAVIAVFAAVTRSQVVPSAVVEPA